ncbi:B12-binding domain-containing radical SAM protein [Infirmifilum sp. NZ]|uniref:B12-binding domain-containing radical SAM protein n=1 Tax=Infirmifilum sp. NZ TaxID=2926850 RepID=UPI0027A52FB2|nr:radical SAM protein [Infirmifilum sp. NZ]UNQ72503.1 radical SAM protein [Infirmifilum sp. NZ]
MDVAEINAVRKRYRRGMLKVGLIYPSFYRVAADSLAFQMLYYYLNSQEDVIAERFVLNDDGSPRVVSLESQSPLRSFDVVLISVHYELDFANILRFILASALPLRSRERDKPLFMAGGPPVIANPTPLSEYIDVLAVGEIEEIVPSFLDALRSTRDERKALLDSLAPDRGFYVPELHEGEEVSFIFARSLLREFHPVAQFQPAQDRNWRRRTAIETSRGCFRGCRFCLEGRIFNVVRERDVGDVIGIALEGREANGSSFVKLVSLSFFDHSRADNILEALVEEGFEFSVPSLRAETLNEKRLEMIRLGGQKTLTVAPETGSKELAMRIGKYLSLERVTEVAQTARKLGFTGLKVYLMVGLPGEDEGSLDETVSYILRLSGASGFKGERELKITVSPFVPKPHTPLQDQAFVGLEEARRRIQYLRRRLAGLADVRAYDPRLALIQTVISRGDAHVGKALAEWARIGGGLGSWRKAVAGAGLDLRKYLGEQQPPHPWDFIRLQPRAIRLKLSQ